MYMLKLSTVAPLATKQAPRFLVNKGIPGLFLFPRSFRVAFLSKETHRIEEGGVLLAHLLGRMEVYLSRDF
jgi:hypothetical protein